MLKVRSITEGIVSVEIHKQVGKIHNRLKAKWSPFTPYGLRAISTNGGGGGKPLKYFFLDNIWRLRRYEPLDWTM